MSRLKDYIRLIIGWPLSIVSIIFILKLIYDQRFELIFEPEKVNLIYLLFGTLLFFLYYFLRSFLWQTTLKAQGSKIPFKENTYRFSFSELKRYTPGNIWSFLSRS